MFKLSSKIVLSIVTFLFWGTVLYANEAREGGDPVSSKETDLRKKAAEVNGVPILFSTFQEAMKKELLYAGHRELSSRRMEEIKQEVLDQLIYRELVNQKAREEKVDPNELVRREIYEKATVQDEEIKSYYQTHSEEFMRPEGVRLRHLLVRVDPSSSNDGWKRGYEKALELSKRANQGEDFGVLIEKQSDPEAKYFGGDSKIQYKGQMAVTEFEPVAFTLNEKEVSRPIQTLYGFSLIQAVQKVLPEPFPFSEVNQERLKKKLSQEKEGRRSREWIHDLKSQADIRFYPE